MKTWPIVLLLTGCASGPVPTGPSSYMLSAKTLVLGGGVGDAKMNAFREAADFCAKQGKAFIPSSGSDRPGGFGRPPEAEVHFLCLDKSDPRYVDASLRKEADVKVEVKK